MSDPARSKYERLMDEIRDLEKRIEELEAAKSASAELDTLEERLEERMFELARITDGCQKIHVKKHEQR